MLGEDVKSAIPLRDEPLVLTEIMRNATLRVCFFLSATLTATAQFQVPLQITLQEAMARARKYGFQIESANIGAALAREDRVQARAAMLPSLNAFNQFIYTEGNGTPSGVFVANDSVHIYNEQAQVHQELLAIVRRAELHRAQAAEAVAKAKVDVAARGLNATVVQDYYAIVSAQRKLINAQHSVDEALQFLDITQKQEVGGEVAHADVIKAQLQVQQRQRDLVEAQLIADKARITLAVLIFPGLRQDYSVVDDLQTLAPLATAVDIQSVATLKSPDLRVARFSVRQAGFDVAAARYAYLPSFALDFAYGINANQLAARSRLPEESGPRGYRQNLGYSGQATLNVPVWNWGAIRSKVKQAALREQQARLDYSVAERQLQATVATAYEEARVSKGQLDSLQNSASLSAESLRLTLLRYRAGEATALEVVDAQTTLMTARNAYDDGLVRYRVALASVESLMGRLP